MLSHAQKYNDTNHVELVLGEHFLEIPPRQYTKTIVFDLDETIGHFKQLYSLYQLIVQIVGRPVEQAEFNELLDLYPEFFRVGIFSIFDLLYQKKRKGLVGGLYIYTNNKCEGDWVKKIAAYINSKVCRGNILFDDLILAFKIRNRVVELRRTTDTKTYSDLIRCIMLPEEDVEVCFIDNTEYTRMFERKVFYILPSPYFHSLKNAEVMARFSHLSFIAAADKKRIDKLFMTLSAEVSTRHPAQTIEATRKIMYYVREYLMSRKYTVPTTNRTRRAGKKKTAIRQTQKN
jgi:hypothetical protein